MKKKGEEVAEKSLTKEERSIKGLLLTKKKQTPFPPRSHQKLEERVFRGRCHEKQKTNPLYVKTSLCQKGVTLVEGGKGDRD